MKSLLIASAEDYLEKPSEEADDFRKTVPKMTSHRSGSEV